MSGERSASEASQPTPEDVAWIHPALRAFAVPIASLKLDPRNARRHSRRNLDAIKALLARVGQLRLIVIGPDGVIDAGNGTVMAAKELGRTHIAALPWDADAATRRMFAIGDNRSAELAEWDPDRLAEDLSLLQAANLSDVAGFNVDEIHDLLERNRSGTGTGVEEVEDAPIPDVPTTRLGDVWMFPTGHRVMCGDATNSEHLKTLLQGELVDLVNTDAPYGVAYEAAGHAPIRNDQLKGDELADFLTRAFKNLAKHANQGAAFYLWYATDTRREFELAMQRAGLRERQQIVWVKPSHTLGRADYQWQHEPCFYAAKDDAHPMFHGDRAESTVWTIMTSQHDEKAIALGAGVVVSDGRASLYVQARAPKGKKPRTVRLEPGATLILAGDDDASDVWQVAREAQPDHPTQKPVALAARAIRNSTRPGEAVLDVFLGSGWTLLAAEQLGRRCFGMDLDAAYVDRAVLRYAKLTGRYPVNQHGAVFTPPSPPDNPMVNGQGSLPPGENTSGAAGSPRGARTRALHPLGSQPRPGGE